jgi:hypothetical protein
MTKQEYILRVFLQASVSINANVTDSQKQNLLKRADEDYELIANYKSL